MRIDSHQHFWRYDPAKYPWISDEMPQLKRDYLPEELKPLLDRTGIEATVAVQAQHSLQETDWLLELADRYDYIKGVVGWLDLRSSSIREQLQTYARHPKMKGVRHIVHDEADDRFLLRSDVLHGLSLLAEFDLTYDLLLFPRHLPVAVECVEQFPQQRFVLDHIAKPPIKAQHFDPWERDIRTLAQFENVYCKVSGMVTEAAWGQWKPDHFTRYLDVVVDCFGVDRLMFGSDWPVCTLSGSYAEVVLLVQEYVRGLSIDVQEKIFGGNAADFYKLSMT